MKKKMELNKRLFLNKSTIASLTPAQQMEFMGGVARPTTKGADCGTATDWQSLCICPPSQGGACSYGTICCPLSTEGNCGPL